jgi:hypothetical protein
MLATVYTIDDGTANPLGAGLPYVILSAVNANVIQKRYGAVRVLSPDSNPVYIGGPTVGNDGSNGFPLDSGFSVVTIDLDNGDELYAISASGNTKTVTVLANTI